MIFLSSVDNHKISLNLCLFIPLVHHVLPQGYQLNSIKVERKVLIGWRIVFPSFRKYVGYISKVSDYCASKWKERRFFHTLIVKAFAKSTGGGGGGGRNLEGSELTGLSGRQAFVTHSKCGSFLDPILRMVKFACRSIFAVPSFQEVSALRLAWSFRELID